jgi:hypothetical protein
MTTYTAPNGTTFDINEHGEVSIQSPAIDHGHGNSSRGFLNIPARDLIAYLLQLPLSTVMPTPNAPPTATVRQALDALSKVAGWNVNETAAENEKRTERP